MNKTFFVFLLLLFTIPLASAQSVSIGDYSIVVDSEVIVPIDISEAESIAGGVVNVSFNPSIVSVENVDAGDFGTPVPNVNNESGWIKLVAARFDAVNKTDAVLANIVFRGVSAGTTDLIIIYASLNNETGGLITPTISNGSITVSPSSAIDLTLASSDITFSNPNPAAGEMIKINAAVHNTGSTSVDNVTVQFFDNGIQIGFDQIIGSINAGETETAQVNWTAAYGSHNTSVMVDPYNEITESNETNNR